MLPHLLALLSAFAYFVASCGYLARLRRGMRRRTANGTGSPDGGTAATVTDADARRVARLRIVLLIGLLAHTGFVIDTQLAGYADHLEVGRLPLLVSLLSSLLVGIFLGLDWRLRLSGLGAFVAPLGFFLFLCSAVLFHLRSSGGPGDAHGFLVTFHLLAIIVAYALFVLSACVSAAYLVHESMLKRKHRVLSNSPLPSITVLDRFNRMLVGSGFLLLIIGVIVGMISGATRDLDRTLLFGRLMWALPVFIVYGVVVGASFGRGMRGRRVAWMTLCGLLSVIVSFVAGGITRGGFHAH